MISNVRSNVVVNLIRTITMTILSFITFPFVCRVLGDAGLGMYSWATAFVYYFLILARISIPNIAVRECVKVKNNPDLLNKKVQEFLILQSCTTLISFVLMTILVFSIPSLRENQNLIFIVSINFLTGVFSFEWLYTAMEKHAYMSIRTIIIATIVNILIFAFVKQPEHVYLYAFLCILTTILTVISNLIFLPSIIKFKKVEAYDFKQYYPILGILFLISLVVALYDKTDTVILGFIDQSKASVGSYSVGMKGVEIVIGFITALSTVFIPRASEYYQDKDIKQFSNLNKYSMNVCLLIVVPAIALLIALAGPFTSLISGNYIESVSGYKDANIILITLCSLMITYCTTNIIYTQILIPMKKEKYYLYTFTLGVILNISLSLLFSLVFFKEHQGFGVSLATSITDLIILIVMFKLTWNYSKILLLNKNNIKIIIMGILIGLFAGIVGPLLFNAFNSSLNIESSLLLEIIIIFIISAIIYLVGLFLLKEKLIMSIKNKKTFTNN